MSQPIRLTTMRRPAVVVTLVATVALALARPAQAEIAVGDRAPELDSARCEAGRPFRIKRYRGKWVLVTFGGSWCKPCKAELPAWDKLAPEYRGKVTFVAVNIDNDPKKGKKFNDKLKLRNLTRVYLPADAAVGDDAYETGTFPSTFVIDPKGIIRFVHRGYESGDAGKVREALGKLLGQA